MATADETIQAAVTTTAPGSRQGLQRFLGRPVVPRLVLIMGAILFMAPFYWMVVSALKTPKEGTRVPPTMVPETFVWQNFLDAVNYIPFFTFALNSLIITLGITIGAVLSTTLVP